MDFSGIIAPLTTPFAADGSVSLADLKGNMELYNRTALRGYVIAGSTGEAMLLSWPETDAIWNAVRDFVAPGKLLIAGTGVETTAETIERTRRAAELGFAAALVKPPHYYKPQYKPEILAAHFQRVADTSPIPIILYSIPQFTGIVLEAADVARLAEHPNIIGIKESSGNVQRASEIIAAAHPGFHVLVGSASALYPSLCVGACGGILALADVLPELCVEIFDAFRAGLHPRARQLQQALLPASQLIASAHGTPGVKCAMDLRGGYRGGAPRLPLQRIVGEQRKEIERCLKPYLAAQGAPA